MPCDGRELLRVLGGGLLPARSAKAMLIGKIFGVPLEQRPAGVDFRRSRRRQNHPWLRQRDTASASDQFPPAPYPISSHQRKPRRAPPDPNRPKALATATLLRVQYEHERCGEPHDRTDPRAQVSGTSCARRHPEIPCGPSSRPTGAPRRPPDARQVGLLQRRDSDRDRNGLFRPGR